MPKAIVIGGGFGGIAAALRLRAKGYAVTLIDKQDQLGGRATQYRKQTEHGTFLHDAGPTVITAKFLFDELFALFGKRREDYVEFRDLYPWYRIVFAGEGNSPRRHGDTEREENSSSSVSPCLRGELPFFDYGGTLEQFEAEIARFNPADVEGFRKYLAHSKKISDKGFTELGDQPFHEFSTMLKCAPDLIRLGAWRTVWQMSSRYIQHPLLRRVFSFQPLLVGGNPFNTTSIYSLIFYLERQWGVQFAMGGTGAIVRGLQKLMEEEGIEIRLATEVRGLRPLHASGLRVATNNPATTSAVEREVREMWKRDRGDMTYKEHFLHSPAGANAAEEAITLEDGETDASAVIVNADPPHVYRNLIAPEHRPTWIDAKIDALKYSMGLFVLYFGTTRQYPDVAHHTIVLGEAYRELLTKIFDEKQLERRDLSVYLHRPTATDPSMAPEGTDSFYVLVPVPNLQPRRVGTAHHPDPEVGGAHPTPVPTTETGAIDWAAFGDSFKQDVIRYLERTVLPGLSDCITGDFYVTPEHFRDHLNTHYGTGFSIQPIFRQSAWFRFHNKSEDIDGLYFVGAGTHPGAGMPGVLCSAKVLDRLIPAVDATRNG